MSTAARDDAYPQAARVISLYLKEFCDDSLTYPEMIAEAARRAAAELDAARAELDGYKADMDAAAIQFEREAQRRVAAERAACAAIAKRWAEETGGESMAAARFIYLEIEARGGQDAQETQD